MTFDHLCCSARSGLHDRSRCAVETWLEGKPGILTPKITFPVRGLPFLAWLSINDILEVPIIVVFQPSDQRT